MFDTNTIKQLYLKKLDKTYKELSIKERAILADVIEDNMNGRYPKFLKWSVEEQDGFLRWLHGLGIEYSELINVERWAYEDTYDEGL